MHRLNLDEAATAIQDFVRSLPLEPDGVELELRGEVLCRVTRPTQLSDAQKQELLTKVRDRIRATHAANKDLRADEVAHAVGEAVQAVRGRRRR